jgi:hypothetical protein
MISINIQGGLGNQLFMVFATFAYSIQYNSRVIFPYHQGDRKRVTYWDNFFNAIDKYTTRHPDNQIEVNSFENFNEPTFMYRALPDFGDKHILLQGYYQSHKYFEAYKNEIYQIIELPDKKQNICNTHSQLFDKPNACIHFRLGDYKYVRYYHPVMNYEYYEAAIAHVFEKKPEIQRILYLCEKEDNEYVESQIKKLEAKFPSLEFVKVDDSLPDYDQLLIMSCCDHNIMANSTFSWWGAYLNDNPDKIVCYPSVWFGQYYEHTHDFSNMMADDWVKIVSSPVHYKTPLS